MQTCEKHKIKSFNGRFLSITSSNTHSQNIYIHEKLCSGRFNTQAPYQPMTVLGVTVTPQAHKLGGLHRISSSSFLQSVKSYLITTPLHGDSLPMLSMIDDCGDVMVTPAMAVGYPTTGVIGVLPAESWL